MTTSPAEHPRPEREPPTLAPLTVALAGMAAMVAAMGIGRFVYTPILPAMMQDLGLSVSEAGFIASSNYAGYLLGAVLAGGGWGTGRERSVILASLGVLVATLFVMAIGSSLIAFLIWRFVAGVASAFILVFAASIVLARLANAGRSDLGAWHFGGVGLGIALSSALIGIGIAAGWSWRIDWVVSGLLGLGAIAVVALLMPPPLSTAGQSSIEPPLRWPLPLSLITISYGLFGASYIVTATFVIAIIREAGAGAYFESLAWLFAGLAGFPSVWLWQKLVPFTGRTGMIAIACIVEAFGVYASVGLPAPFGAILGAGLLGGTFIAITATGLQVGQSKAGASPRRALAAMTVAFSLGQIIGPVLAGIATDLTGSYEVASFCAAAVLIVSAAFAFACGQAERRVS